MRRAVLLSLLALACSTYREDLNRGQRLYEEKQYDHALSIWRMLEDDVDSLSQNDQARYAYLRGMTNYRLGYRPYARHWLGIARALEKEHPGGLNDEWKERLQKSLEDLDKDVYGGAERFGEQPSEGADSGAPESIPPSGP